MIKNWPARGLLFILWASLASTPLFAAQSDKVGAAQNSIEAISVTPSAGGKVAVKVSLRQAPANVPASFSVNNPPRIAFDFVDTANNLPQDSQEVGEANLKSIKVVQAGNRTRLVMNLAQMSTYETQIQGNNLLIVLQGASGSEAAPDSTAVSHFAEPKSSDLKHSLRDIDFRRGPNGEGRIVVELSDPTIGIDLRQQGKRLVIDFLKTSLPQSLERRLDVTDFATPVQSVDAVAQGQNARIIIEPKGLWEHSAYQTDNRFILEVRPIAEDPNKLVQGGKPGYSGEKLSLNFQNVDVRSVLQVIADFTGLNIITSDTVAGNLTLRLKDVPWDQALEIILRSKGLDKRKEGNVILIAPREELATREKLELESRQQISDLEPLYTETFQLNYQKAEAFQKILTDPAQKILSKRGSAVIDPRTNSLFVQDIPAKLEDIRKLLRKVDVPVRQVMIESRIVEASDTFSRSLGVRLGVLDRRPGDRIDGNRRITVGGQLAATGFLTTQINTPIPTLDQSLGVNLPAPTIPGASPGVLSVILFNESLAHFVNLELSALQADGRGKIISSPRVITADQVEAVIEQGTEIPYQQATSSGATSTSFRKATLSLKVKPQITPDDNVIMTLNVHKDSVGQNIPGSGPSIDTKQVATEVLVENGGTVVIGGIYIQEEQSTINKVPLLGDIPYLGNLFKSKLKTDNKSELLIFITPRIIKDTLTVR